jgi:putative transposase
MKRDAAVGVIETYAISQRRACRLVSVDPKTVRREAVSDNAEIRTRMREIAAVRRRFGYRRIGLMLEREGITMNHKKLRRLYTEEGLALKRRHGRKRATGTREPMSLPDGPTKRWSLDFVADVFGAARRFRMLNVIDDQTRECLALVADTSLSGARAARLLDRCIRLYGRPQTIVSDNGTELTSRAILEW